MFRGVLLLLLLVFSLFAEPQMSEGLILGATGNEPGWVLEIHSEKRALLLTNLGKDKTLFEITGKFSEHGSTEYKMRSNYNVLHVRIEKRRCQDTMADSVYASTVYINFDGVNMKGCG